MKMIKLSKKKICVVTGTRAEYGLLYPLMKEIQKDESLELLLIVTGMHLSPEFGLTYKEIEKEFFIDKKVEILLSSDTPIGISKSMGLAQISFSEAYSGLNPDMVVVLGDRYEIFAAVSAAMICCIPIAHLDGGEITQGAFDDAIRHSITKMSHLHFTNTNEYKNRVIQLGEEPNRVFNTGGTFLDNIKSMKLLSKEEFEDSIDFKLNKKNLSVTFHPETLSEKSACEQFKELLEALDTLKDTSVIFTKANSDTEGRMINSMIDDYVNRNKDNTIAFASMGQLRYLSSMQFVDALVGNSSSGITEAPFFKIATINIGERQKGRIRTDSIIDCAASKSEIIDALDRIYSLDFQKNLKSVKNPYGDGKAGFKIKEIIKKFDFSNILKKRFYDIEGLDER